MENYIISERIFKENIIELLLKLLSIDINYQLTTI